MKRASQSMVVAVAAMIVALGTSATAAVTIRKNSVGPGQIKPNAVKSSDIKGNSIRFSDLTSGVRGAVTGGGVAGPTGAAGSAGAYAVVRATTPPTVIAAQSNNVTSANVVRDATGSYCIGSLPITPRIAVASAISSAANVGVHVGSANANTICTGKGLTGTLTHVTVLLHATGNPTDVNFNIWFEV